MLDADDLLVLWGHKIRNTRMTVQYPEISAHCLPGSIHSPRVLAWKISSFVFNVVVKDPAVYLSPSVSGDSAVSHARDGLLSPQRLKELYPIARRSSKTHLLFVFRYSQKSTKDHQIKHMREAVAIASRIHNSGIADVASILIICGKYTRGCSIPSFDHDIEKEIRLAAGSMVSARRSAESISRVSLCSSASIGVHYSTQITFHRCHYGAPSSGRCLNG